MGCFPVDFQEGKRPLETKSKKRPIKVGKQPIKKGKRPIKAMVLVGSSVGCLMGCFRAPQPWRKTALLKRPIKRSMTKMTFKLFQGSYVECSRPSLRFVQEFLFFFFPCLDQGLLSAPHRCVCVCDGHPALPVATSLRCDSSLSFFSLVFLFPWRFSCWEFPWSFWVFSAYFPGFLRVDQVRKILGVFEVFLGLFAKTKEKKDRVGRFLVVLYNKPLWRKEKWKQRRKGDVRDVKNYHRRCWKTGKGITAMTL